MHNLDAVAIFVEVVRAGSFTGAARAMNIPLSTVSRKVGALETDLQIRLFDRSQKPLRITPAGQVYFDLCVKGIDALSYANQAIRGKQDSLSGTLRITVPPNLTEIVFAKSIDQFLHQHPGARIRVMVSERMLDFVEHNVDLSFRVARPTAPNLVIRKLLTHRHRLCAAPSYLAVNAPPQSPPDLKKHLRIGFGFEAQDTVNWQLTRGELSHSEPFEPTLAINDYLAVKAAIQTGTGIGELPGLLCRDELADGRLTEVLPEWRLPEITLYAVYAGKVGLSKLARAFLDEVSSQLAQAQAR